MFLSPERNLSFVPPEGNLFIEKALRENKIYDALLARRQVWYEKYRPGKEIPLLSSKRKSDYLKRAFILDSLSTSELQWDHIVSLSKKHRNTNYIKQWQRDFKFANRVLEEQPKPVVTVTEFEEDNLPEARTGLRAKWESLSPRKRRQIGIYTVLVGSTLALGALALYAFLNRRIENQETIPTIASGISQLANELMATATPTVTRTPILPSATPIPTKEIISTVTKPTVIPEATRAVATVVRYTVQKAKIDLAEILAEKNIALMIKNARVELLKIVRGGLEIAKGCNPWQTSERVAGLIMKYYQIATDKEVLKVLADAIKDLSGWADRGQLAKAGDAVRFNPQDLSAYLSATLEKIRAVMAAKGQLEVPLSEGDLKSLQHIADSLPALR